jgi:hypothetical protein
MSEESEREKTIKYLGEIVTNYSNSTPASICAFQEWRTQIYKYSSLTFLEPQ